MKESMGVRDEETTLFGCSTLRPRVPLDSCKNEKESAKNEYDRRGRPAYATIDCLALKRTRLPLQLVPIDGESPDPDRLASIIDRRAAESSAGGAPRDPSFEDDFDYDDVGPPFSGVKKPSVETLFEEMGLYDDVVPRPVTETSGMANPDDFVRVDGRSPYFSIGNIGNDYSSVEDFDDDEEEDKEGRGGRLEDDEDYDDVWHPSQERVNSLYAGSSSGSQLGSLATGKESEWEDLDEQAAVKRAAFSTSNILASKNSESHQGSPGRKKMLSRHRRTRIVGRRRSIASRNNRSMRSCTTARPGASTMSDTASDDSNYEAVLLSSFPSDEFSSTAEEDDDQSVGNCSTWTGGSEPVYPEAPSRPVPPPPRESSLTESFGKRIKMLRRTWSITKGSLGRMRRRTSASNTGSCETNERPSNHAGNDARKYFSFKKSFGKSVTGLSTFYLESRADGNENNERLSSNNNRSEEEIYGNSRCDFNHYANTDCWKSSRNAENEVGHRSSLVEEPLYQFYAAATTRVALESDSEGYEEVGDPTETLSAVDLGGPGCRTLWCQTTRVVNSGLLQRLTPDDKKCQEAKFEFLTSEASYLNSLRVLVEEFSNDRELMHEVLTPSERDKLFGEVPGVLVASERLLARLEVVWRDDPMLVGLPEILFDHAQASSAVYVAYCSNQVSIDSTLRELRSRKGSKFVDAVTRIESHAACQSLTLHSFLMLPMQRVTRLPLLADAVLSKMTNENKDERIRWERALSHLARVVVECNEGARAAGRLAEMESLERKLEYSAKVPPILLRDRYPVRRGPVTQVLAKSDVDYKLTFGKKYHKAPLYLLLLNDHLLVAKPKSSANEETYLVIDTCKRSLVALEGVSQDSPFAGRNAMVLSLLENHLGRHVEYILCCESATERERWLDAVAPPKPSLVGESLYETWDCPQVIVIYSYAAVQPDELTVQPGDVINVLRKMSDGWYLGEKLLGGEQGWFPGNYAKEVASEHVRARNLRQRHRLLALSTSVLQQRAKHAVR